MRYRTIAFLLAALLPAITAGKTVGQFQAIDIDVPHSELGVRNVWDDVTVTCALTSPMGKPFTIGGFYHSKDLWKARFAPDETGWWHYTITIRDNNGETMRIDSFECVPSQEQGFIRLHPGNPKRWIYSGTGNLYSAVGFGDCMGADRDSIMQFAGLDGGYRPEGYHEGIGWQMPYSQYLYAYYDAAGFNIYRYSDGNCAYSIRKTISISGNDYDTLHSRWTDTLFAAMRSRGTRIFMTILLGPIGNAGDSASMAPTLRYVQYCIDRYGALVDFWELTNEADPDSLWIARVANYIHTQDPYGHLVSMSNQKPSHPAIDIISPHWYGREPVTSSDNVTADQIGNYKSYAKPVIYGEQGEGGWDNESPIRLRGRIWSALFNEGVLIFWNSSFAKDCPCNQYLGWEERRYARVMQNFAALLDSGVRKITPRQIGAINVWELRSQKITALYLRNHTDVTAKNSGVQIPLTIPSNGIGVWYDVHTGDILASFPVVAGAQTLTAPEFETDVAFIGGATQLPKIDSLFRIEVTPRTVEFFDVPIGKPGRLNVTVANTGERMVRLENWMVSSPSPKLSFLSVSPGTLFPLTLAPKEKVVLMFDYVMDDTGAASAMISIVHDASPAWENVAVTVVAKPQSAVEDRSPEQPSLTVFPDPAANAITVESALALPLTARLLAIDGSIIAEQALSVTGAASFDVLNLASGVYQVQLLESGAVIAAKKVAVVH